MRSFKLFIALCFLGYFSIAQKLPNKQTGGLIAPANVKIDGNIAEWGNLQAYNHATDIAYTIANDDKNLYFIIKADNPAVVTKIINGGITLGINKANKQNKADISITYPVFEKGAKPVISINKALLEKGGSVSAPASDVDVQQTNNSFANKSKLIMVTGITVVDTLLSIYNENGIKVVAHFDDHLAYNCELAIPISKLGLATDKFSYHVTLNGESPLTDHSLGDKLSAIATNDVVEAKLAAQQSQLGRNTAPTDFWGEYTLVRK